VYAALEQETSRAVSAAAVHGEAVAPIARRAAVLAGYWFAVLVALVLLAWPLLLGRVLDGRPGLLGALIVAIAGSGGVYWARGLLGGRQRFGVYARTLYVEGAVRLLPCLLLLGLGVAASEAYGLAFALGSAAAALSVVPALRPGGPTAPPDGSPEGLPDGPAPPRPVGMGRSLAYLVAAIALSQLLANLAPVVVSYRSDDLVAAAVFGSTFVLARIPLFLFAPVQAVLLPKLTRAATMGRHDELVRQLRRAVSAVVGLGLLGVVGCVTVGPWAAQQLFNTALRPSVATLALLGAATAIMMMALVVQPTLVAMGRQRLVTWAWVAGSMVFLAVLVLPVPPISAALAAQLAGPAVVLAVLAGGALGALRDPGRPGGDRLAPQAADTEGQ